MTSGFIKRSNIFGVESGADPAQTSEPTSSSTSPAGRLIDHLKWVADNQIATAGARADWLALAANQGQNTDPGSLVRGELTQPEALSRASVLAGWSLPSIAASPLTLPTIPDNLKVDWQKVLSDAAADVAALQNSWMARYLPDVTDITRLDALFTDILDGSGYAAARDKLNGLETETKAALTAITADTLAALSSAIASAKASIGANLAAGQAGISSAYAQAASNAATVAWTRARDQAAREAARQEREAVSLWASRGFTLPGGALNAMSARARQAAMNATVESAAIQAEKTHQMYFDAARAEVESWLRSMEVHSSAEFNALRAALDGQLKFAELELESNRAKAKQAMDHLGLTLDFTKFSGDLAAKYRDNAMRAMSDLIRAYASLRGNEVQYLEGISRSQVAAQDAVLDYYRAAMASAELGMKVDVVNNETSLRWAEIAARFIGTAVGHHVQAAASAADVFSRTAGMALSGINGVASVSSNT